MKSHQSASIKKYFLSFHSERRHMINLSLIVKFWLSFIEYFFLFLLRHKWKENFYSSEWKFLLSIWIFLLMLFVTCFCHSHDLILLKYLFFVGLKFFFVNFFVSVNQPRKIPQTKRDNWKFNFTRFTLKSLRKFLHFLIQKKNFPNKKSRGEREKGERKFCTFFIIISTFRELLTTVAEQLFLISMHYFTCQQGLLVVKWGTNRDLWLNSCCRWLSKQRKSAQKQTLRRAQT